MRKVQPRSAALALLLGAAGCAHAAPGEDPRAQAADQPELLGCTSYAPPLRHWTTENRLWVEVVVQPNGTVLPGSPRHVPTRYDRGDREAVTRALEMARSCTFAPARKDGQPVQASTRLRLAFD